MSEIRGWDPVNTERALATQDPVEFEQLWDEGIDTLVANSREIRRLMVDTMRSMPNAIFRDNLTERKRTEIPFVAGLPNVAQAISTFSETRKGIAAFTRNLVLAGSWLGRLICFEMANINNCAGPIMSLSAMDDTFFPDEERVDAFNGARTSLRALENPLEYLDGGHGQHIKDIFSRRLIELPHHKSTIIPADPVATRRAIRGIMLAAVSTFEQHPDELSDGAMKVEYNENKHEIAFHDNSGLDLFSSIKPGPSRHISFARRFGALEAGGAMLFGRSSVSLMLGPMLPATGMIL